MLRIASLVGYSGSGKSTLAQGIDDRMSSMGYSVSIVKKDEAIQAISTEKYGDTHPFGAFSLKGLVGANRTSQHDLHNFMNQSIHEDLTNHDLVILEGGTRTRTAQNETLSGIDTEEFNFGIFLMQIPFREIIARLHARRTESNRIDDTYPILFGKLAGQWIRPLLSNDVPRPTDQDVTYLDATLPVERLADLATEIILNP